MCSQHRVDLGFGKGGTKQNLAGLDCNTVRLGVL